MLNAFFSWIERRKIKAKEETEKAMQVFSQRMTPGLIDAVDTGLPFDKGYLFRKTFRTSLSPYYGYDDEIDGLISSALGQLYQEAMAYLKKEGAKYYRMKSHYSVSGYYEGDNQVWIDVETILTEPKQVDI
jgi:hypothetical protein